MRVDTFFAAVMYNIGTFFWVWFAIVAVLLFVGSFLSFGAESGGFLDRYGLVPGISVFVIGLIFAVCVSIYALSNAAPVAWFARLPVAEGKYFKKHMRHAQEPLSINQFVLLDERFHHGKARYPSLKDQLDSIR